MLSRANVAPGPPVYNGNACASQVPCYRSLPSPHLHRTNSTGCGHVSLPESTLQSKHDLVQVNPMFLQKLRLAQKMVRIQIPPVMPRTQRDCRKVRGLLPQASWPQGVRVCGFDQVIPGLADRIDSIATSGQLGAKPSQGFSPTPPLPTRPVPRRWSPESSTTWVERTDWSASSGRLPLGARNSRRGLILPSLLIWSQYDPRGGRCSYWSARSRSLVSTKARNSRTDARAVSRLRDTTAS